MKKYTLALVLGFALAGTCVAAPLKIGAVYASSGFLKVLSDSSWRGTQAAAALAKRSGQDVEVIYLPFDSTPAMAAQVVREALVNHPDIAAFVGIVDTDPALAAGRVATDAGKVFVTSGATSPLLPRQLGPRFFLACFGDNVQAAAAAEWLRGEKKAARVAVIYNRSKSYTRLLQRYFADAFRHAGGEVNETISYGNGEPAGLPRELRACDAVFVAAESAVGAGKVISKLRAAGFKGPIVGGDSYDDPDFWSGETLAENVYFTTHVYPAKSPGAASAAVLSAFRAAYRGTPDAFGGLGFDALRLVLAAEPGKGGDLAKRLQNGAPLSGVTGSIAYQGGSRIPSKPVALVAAEHPRQMMMQLTPAYVPAP
jgi:branched-chain amino acid transport system substrate-binding protein